MGSSLPASRQNRLALVFPGQGSQQAGMGKILLESDPEVEHDLRELSHAAGTDLLHLLCDASSTSDPIAVHLTMVAFGLTAWKSFCRKKREKPDFMAWHCLGELTALACAGALTAEEALRLARIRGECIAAASAKNPGKMLALFGLPLDELKKIHADWRNSQPQPPQLWEANYNGPEQMVISGNSDDVDKFSTFLKKKKIKRIALATAGAFHTPLILNAAKEFAQRASDIKVQPPQIPVVSSRSGRLMTHWHDLSIHLSLQIIEPVKWLETMRFLQMAEVGTITEVAPPHGVLDSLARRMNGWQVKNFDI